jgi:glycosyltransferase involved in cell wall biosynthesis
MATIPPRKIVLTANTAWYLFHFRLGLIRKLIANGCEVLVWAPEDSTFAALADAGAKPVHLPIDGKGLNPINDLGLWRAYRRRMFESRPDMVLAFTIKPVIWGGFAASQMGISYLSTITGLGTAFIRDGWLTRVAETLYRRSQHRAAQVFFQNPDDRELFVTRRMVDERRTTIVPGSGIDPRRFQATPLPSTQVGQATFLLIGRMLRDKGVQEFVDAARMLRGDHPLARFQLLGAADAVNRTAISRAQLTAWESEGIIEYLGESADVRVQIAQADCVVLPSYREGIPRVLLEGAAMARPLLATDVPGCREVVRDGVNGYLCEARSAAGLADIMRRILHMPPEDRAGFGHAARLFVEQTYDESIVIGRYCDTLGFSRDGSA